MVSRMTCFCFSALAVSGLAGKTALVIVDVQDCFLEANTTSGNPGSLSVPASQIIPLINSIRNEKSCLFDEVIRTRDFHPAGHISFGSTHGLAPFSHLSGKGGLPLTCTKPSISMGVTADAACCPTFYINGDGVDRSDCTAKLCPPEGWNYSTNMTSIISDNTACTLCKTDPSQCFETTQAMWTDHCLQTGDSTFPPSLVKKDTDIIVKKGTNLFVDAYSAFMDNTQSLKTELDSILQDKGIDTLYVAGIATDVCVHATVRDAFSNKTGSYSVSVIKDATAAVLGDQSNFDTAIDDMRQYGAAITTVAEVLNMECPPPLISYASKLTVGTLGLVFMVFGFLR